MERKDHGNSSFIEDNGRMGWVKKFLIAQFVLVCLFVMALAAIPSTRQTLHQRFFKNKHQILSKIQADVTGNGDLLTILKVASSESLVLEVFLWNREKHKNDFLQRLTLVESRDAFLKIQDQRTNLALIDKDKDGILDLIVPVFDDNIVPRIYTYKFHPESMTFELSNL